MSRLSLFLVVLILHLSACSRIDEGSPSHSFQISTQDGVTIAENKGGPKYTEPLFDLVETVQLYQDENDLESLLYQVFDYRLADDGRFYVMDDRACRVAVFDERGQYLHSFGAKGNGPGELSDPILRWVQNGRLVIDDDNQYRLSLWRTDGILLEMFPNPAFGNIWDMYLSPTRQIIIKVRKNLGQQADGGRTYAYQATIFSPEGDLLESISAQENYQSPPYRAGGMSVVPNGRREYFAPIADLDYYPGLGIVTYNSAEPILNWYDLNGRLTKIIHLGLENRLVSADDRRAVQDMLQNRINATEDPRRKAVYTQQKQQVSFMDYKAFWSEVLVDDLGYYWLKDFPLYGSDMREAVYRVFSPEGEYLGDTKLTEDLVSICQGHICTIRVNSETGGDEFIVYRLESQHKQFRYP